MFGQDGVPCHPSSSRARREDAWKYHADDIYRIGGRVSDYDLAAILAQSHMLPLNTWKHWVFIYQKTAKPISLLPMVQNTQEHATPVPKQLYILRKPLSRTRQLGINVIENSMIISLQVENGQITGALESMRMRT